MRIVLMRHGKPDMAGRKGISASEFALWLDEYNEAGLCSLSRPERETVVVANQCQSKLCSNLRRSIKSLQTVCPEANFVSNALFRELELPHGPWCWPKLGSSIWSVIFRLLWFCGYAYQTESWRQGKRRAQIAVRMLAEEAAANQSVLLAGHYFLNRNIAQTLLREGWVGPASPKGSYWGVSVYEKAPS